MRALATGFFFILAAMVFRRTLTQVMRPCVAVNNIISQLDWSGVQLRERFESNDPRLSEELKKYCNSLGSYVVF